MNVDHDDHNAFPGTRSRWLSPIVARYALAMTTSLSARFCWTSALFIVAAIVSPTNARAADETPVLEYSIDDQFGTTHTEEECRGTVAIFLGGDRKGSAMIPEWGPLLHQALAVELEEGTVCSVGLAHLDGAPFFVKKKIVAGFPKDPDAWTLLDWKGHFLKTWGGEKRAANIYIFDRRGALVMQKSLHEFDDPVFEEIVGVVRSALDGSHP